MHPHFPCAAKYHIIYYVLKNPTTAPKKELLSFSWAFKFDRSPLDEQTTVIWTGRMDHLNSEGTSEGSPNNSTVDAAKQEDSQLNVVPLKKTTDKSQTLPSITIVY